MAPNEFAARVTSTMITFIRSGSWRYESMMNEATAYSFSRAGISRRVDLGDRVEHDLPALEEERVEDLLLGAEVVVDEAVGDARLVGHVRHAAVVEAALGEHAHAGVEDQAALVDRAGLGGGGHQTLASSGQR